MRFVRPLIFIFLIVLSLPVWSQSGSLCTGSLGDPIVNITFGSGDNPGSSLTQIVPQATTTYSFVSVYNSPAFPVPVDGSYTITNNIPGNPAWFGGGTDHTGNANGYMAFFNANPTPGEFYRQQVNNLCPGTVYQFSAWVANVLNANAMNGVKPNITFRIEKTNGTPVASYNTGDIAQSSQMTWLQYGFFFTAPSDGSSLVLKMTNANVGGDAQPGNDFAIDDITFRACGPNISSSFSQNTLQTTLQVCPGDPFILYGKVNPSESGDQYLWQSSGDGGVTWTDIANSNKNSIGLIAPNNPDGFVYRMLSAKTGNINSSFCRTASNIVTLQLKPSCSTGALSCNNWLKINDNGSGIRLDDLDISGQAVTVEAMINSTAANSGGRLYAGDIVSKHSGPSTTNYLLRPNSAEITTSNGYYITPEICNVDLNKTYHVAMVYDGKTLKFYRDGYLMSQVACSGNLYQNNFLTTIGSKASEPNIYPDESFNGYINEVRIWNVARTQNEIKAFINTTLPNPTTQNGLVAYYSFSNLNNRQGNPLWNGTIFSTAQINQTNPNCIYTPDSCNQIISPVIVNASFTAPDTVCVNTKITLTNTSLNATNNYWSFCATDLNTTEPEAVNIGNLNGAVSWPVFMDLVHEGNNYYGFLVDHHPGNLIRLDFGSSFLNTPTTVNLGNFNGILPVDYGAEGIQMVKNNGKWYAIIVGGSVQNNELPRIFKIDFGTDITNTNPAATNWGNIGNLSQPIDLYVFYESGNWYGFSTNSENNTITRFNFGNGFDQPPTGDNLGGFNGAFNYPTGLYPVNDNGNWYLFVTNGMGNTLTRLDFGNSLLNNATATNLGNAGNTINSPRDISIMKSCNSLVGYIVNGSPSQQELIKLDFHNDVLSNPSGTSLGNNGNYSFPHSISKLFRVGNDLYSFVTNVYNNTITRLKFSGCNSSSIPNFEGADPPQISYSSPGIYNILLSVDEGLPTQATYCRQIVVLDNPPHSPTKDTAFCEGTSLRLARSYPNVTYQWNTGSTDSFTTVTAPGKYWVQYNKGYDCTSVDSFNVKGFSNLSLDLGADTGLCVNQSLLLNAGNPGNVYLWQDSSTKALYQVTKSGTYFVKVTSPNNCFVSDTIQVINYASPIITGLTDKKICTGDSVQLIANVLGNTNIISWQSSSSLSDTAVLNPFVSPKDTTQYILTITGANGCVKNDSVVVFVLPKPTVSTLPDTAICNRSSIILQSSIENANGIQWQPAGSLDDNEKESPVAMPASSTNYIITAQNDGCIVSDTIRVNVLVPFVNANNDTTLCGASDVQLNASGSINYQWSPPIGLSNTNTANPVASITGTIIYTVTGVDEHGCSASDSVKISYLPTPVFSISSNEATVCEGDSLFVSAYGGDIYSWVPANTVTLTNTDSSVFLKPDTTTTYTVSISNTICNQSGEQSVIVNVLPSPDVSIIRSNDIDCTKDSAVLTASGGVSYLWSPASGLSNPNNAVTIAEPDNSIIYTVTATGQNGCRSSDTIRLTVLKGGDNKFEIPSAFTPNNDGLNDCFGVRSWKYIRLLDFSIYDRWGVLLFHTNNVSDCWNGKYKGNYEPAGAYIYVIRAETDCGVAYKKNTFILIR